MSRLTANIYHFQTNYAVVFVVLLFFLTVLMEPASIGTSFVICVLWALFLKKNDDPEWSLKVGSTSVSPVQRWGLLVFITLSLLAVTSQMVAQAATLYIVFALFHSLLHSSAKGVPGSFVPI